MIKTLGNGVDNDGSLDWTIREIDELEGQYRIKITDYEDSSIYGYSDYFTITSGEDDDSENDEDDSSSEDGTDINEGDQDDDGNTSSSNNDSSSSSTAVLGTSEQILILILVVSAVLGGTVFLVGVISIKNKKQSSSKRKWKSPKGKEPPADPLRELNKTNPELERIKGRFCPFCGSKIINPNATYCDSCGGKLNKTNKN